MVRMCPLVEDISNKKRRGNNGAGDHDRTEGEERPEDAMNKVLVDHRW